MRPVSLRRPVTGCRGTRHLATRFFRYRWLRMSLTTPIYGMPCYRQAGICYDQRVWMLKCLPVLNTKTWKVMRNIENEVVLGGYGSLEAIGYVTIWMITYDFLFVFNYRLCMHLHRSRFLNVASYLSRVAEFNPHQLHFPTCENENDPVPFHHITHTGIKHCASYMAGTLLTCRSKCSDNIALYVCSVWSKSTLLCTASSLWLVSEV